MRNIALLRRAVLGLMLVVVLLDVRVADLHLARDLLEDLLGDQLRPDVGLHLLVGQALLLELLVVARLTATEVLLLDLLEPIGDLLVGDRDAQIFGFLRELDTLHEVLHRLVLERLVLLRACRRELPLLALVAPLRLIEQLVELLLCDRLAVDLRNCVAGDVAAATPTATGEDRDKRRKKKRGRDRKSTRLNSS